MVSLQQAQVVVYPNSPPILGPLDLSIKRGQCLAVIGPSGSGKSTLLNLIGGLQFCSSGSVSVDGHDLSRWNDEELSRFRNSQVGFIFQSFHLHPSRTVLENLLIPLYFSQSPISQGRQRAQTLLEELGLPDSLNRPVAQLSGGQRQRVAIVRALMCQPTLLLADEPAGNLDEENAAIVLRLLQRLKSEEQVTMCLVTHHPTLLPVADQILELRDGRPLAA